MLIWEKLYRYQQLEKKLVELQKDKNLKLKYQALKEEKVGLEKKVAEFQEVKASTQNLEKPIKKLEQEIDEINKIAKEHEKRLYSGEITNNHELMAAKEHFDQYQVSVSKIEGQLLKLMEEKESANQEINQSIVEIKREKAEFDAKYRAFQEEKAQNTEQQLTIEAEGKKLLDELAKEKGVIDIYEQLKSRFSYPFVAKLNDGICSGCRLGVSYETLKELGTPRSGDPIRCNNCGRVVIL